MEADLRSVPAGLAEEADVDQTAPSFEEFYEATFQRVFTVPCLDKARLRSDPGQ